MDEPCLPSSTSPPTHTRPFDECLDNRRLQLVVQIGPPQAATRVFDQRRSLVQLIRQRYSTISRRRVG